MNYINLLCPGQFEEIIFIENTAWKISYWSFVYLLWKMKVFSKPLCPLCRVWPKWRLRQKRRQWRKYLTTLILSATEFLKGQQRLIGREINDKRQKEPERRNFCTRRVWKTCTRVRPYIIQKLVSTLMVIRLVCDATPMYENYQRLRVFPKSA